MTAWCHGATGPGGAAMTTSTSSAAAHSAGSSCCSPQGRSCPLPGLVCEARPWAGGRIHRAQGHDGYLTIRWLPRGIRTPGLFQGISGIGYELLRLARPRELPVVLLWERPGREGTRADQATLTLRRRAAGPTTRPTS